jgi:uncharacterized protein
LLGLSQCALISTLMRSRYLRIFAPAALFFVLLVGTGSGQNTTLISLDQAIDLALAHNHSMKASGPDSSESGAGDYREPAP